MIEIKKFYLLQTKTTFKQPRHEVFAFFGNAENLQLITPPWLDFKILTPLPIDIQQGTLIDYRLKLKGIPFDWRTEISRWDPPGCFIDRQIKGPYKSWIHEHRFEEGDDHTIMTDRVEYRLPGGPFGSLLHALVVENQLRKIFNFRLQKIQNRFK
jgi:ligand-binding SRPBCC domain-containing protein